MVEVEFPARLQAANRIQVPVEIRWKFKLKLDGEILFVTLTDWTGNEEAFFYARVQRGSRITVPWEFVRDMGLKHGDMLWVTLKIEPEE